MKTEEQKMGEAWERGYEISSLVLRLLEDGNEDIRLFVGLDLQKLGANLHLIGFILHVPFLTIRHYYVM